VVTRRFQARVTSGGLAAIATTDLVVAGQPPVIRNALLSPHTYGWPDETNTGPRVPIGQLRVWEGGLSTSVNGEVFEKLFVRGGLTANASNVVLRDSVIEYRGTLYPVKQSSGRSGLLLDHVRVDGGTADHPGIYSQGGRYTLLGCDVFGSVDGFRIEQDDCEIRDSYFHDQSHPAGAHADAGQIRRGDRTRIIHNTLLAGRRQTGGTWARNNAVLQYGSDITSGDSYDDLWFIGNLCDHGNYCFNGPNPEDMRQRFEDNRFGRDWQFYLTVGDFQTGDDTWLRNVWDDTGALIPAP